METQYYGLLGWPVKHSLSPPMQLAAFKACGIPATYQLVETPPENLAATVKDMVDQGFAGWNITVPHKPAMLELVDEVDPVARQARSVNTVRHRDGRLQAWSTDGYGLERAIAEHFAIPLAGRHFVFWGCGGAATACAFHFAAGGAARLTLVNRTVSKAEKLAAELKASYPHLQLSVAAPTETQTIHEMIAAADLIIQATSIGLKKQDPPAIPAEIVQLKTPIYDMVYVPNRLRDLAREHQCPYADGLMMLLYQGVRSFELWTGRQAPVDIMRNALVSAFQARLHG